MAVCRVVCAEFAAVYGKQQVVFPCWYSQLDSSMVITDLDIQEVRQPLGEFLRQKSALDTSVKITLLHRSEEN